MRTSSLLTVFSASALLLFSACSEGPLQCSLISCESFASVDVTALVSQHQAELPLTVEVCFDTDECETITVDSVTGDTVLVSVPLVEGAYGTGEYDLSVTVNNANGDLLTGKADTMTVSTSSPNGPECGPECTQGSAVVTAN